MEIIFLTQFLLKVDSHFFKKIINKIQQQKIQENCFFVKIDACENAI